MSKEIKVLLLRGTGAPLEGDGIMQAYARGLGDWADIEWVNYPASYGTPSYDLSLQKGIMMSLDALRATDKDAFAMGFSQGADVVKRLHALLNGTIQNYFEHDLMGAELKASFVLADPSRHETDVNLNGPVGGWGIRGRVPSGPNFYGIANPGDPICAYPDGPLRSFADFSAYFGDPDVVEKIWALAKEKQLQPWWQQPNPLDWFRNWGGTVGWINNYLGGFHTDQYITKGYVELLINETNRRARAHLS